MLFLFFFTQKTAYEMRISDWSSDVCSSDLNHDVMAYVIAAPCVSDFSCVEICPVNAIHPGPSDPVFDAAEQLYIDPDTCINCGACVEACPVQIGRASCRERVCQYV